jgi:transcriptional regulator with XRE-family HTH domain
VNQRTPFKVSKMAPNRERVDALRGQLRRRREDLGLTQADLAKRLCVSHASVSNMEEGVVKHPTLLHFMAYANAMGMVVDVQMTVKEGT